MEQRGVTHAHKYSGIEGCVFGSYNFHQDVPKQVCSCSNVQYGSSQIRSKTRRHHQSRTNKYYKRNSILSAIEINYNYSRVFAGVSQHKADHVSRHFQDRSEWLLCSETFQKICQKWGHSRIDLCNTRIFYQVPA